jgi:signal transduction histidine kinase
MMKKVKAAFQAEKEFITNVSHELLTPISILQNRCENVLADPAISEEMAMKMVDFQRTLIRLSKVVKALLYISRIESEQYLRNETVSIQELTSEVTSELEDRIDARGIKIESHWNNDFVLTASNRSLLHPLIFNIISNAIKYNQENGLITITGKTEGGIFQLSIKDSGVGISKEHLPYIYDRFKRFRPEDESSYGLGLPIVKTIAAYHGIEITVDSTPGAGATFTLHFPLQPPVNERSS